MQQPAWSASGRRDGEDGNVMGANVTRASNGSGRNATSPPLKNGNEMRAAGYLVAVGSRTQRFRRKHKLKLIWFLLAMLLLLLILFIVMTILYARQRRHRPLRVCESRECLRSAANLALSMDRSADPCHDFYQVRHDFYQVRLRPLRVCESRECLRSAANLALSMDRSADPCHDFYQVRHDFYQVRQDFYQVRHRPLRVCESRECLRSAANLALSMDRSADPCHDFYQVRQDFYQVRQDFYQVRHRPLRVCESRECLRSAANLALSMDRSADPCHDFYQVRQDFYQVRQDFYQVRQDFYQVRHRPLRVCESRECLRSAANLALSMDRSADPCHDFYQVRHDFYQVRHRPLRVCESRECLRSAANLALSMDRSADPCHDFYQYTCGKWGEEHPRPDALRSYDWFRDKQTRVYALVRDALSRNVSAAPLPVRQSKQFYDACMDTGEDSSACTHLCGTRCHATSAPRRCPCGSPSSSTTPAWTQFRVYALVRDALSRNVSAAPLPVRQSKQFYDACMDTGEDSSACTHLCGTRCHATSAPRRCPCGSPSSSTTPAWTQVRTVPRVRTCAGRAVTQRQRRAAARAAVQAVLRRLHGHRGKLLVYWHIVMQKRVMQTVVGLDLWPPHIRMFSNVIGRLWLLILQTPLRRLKHLQFSTVSSSLNNFVESFNAAMSALENLNIDDLKDFILLNLAMRKLDPITAQAFESHVRGYVQLCVSSKDKKYSYNIVALVLDKLTDRMPSEYIDSSVVQHLMDLPLADPLWHIPETLDKRGLSPVIPVLTSLGLPPYPTYVNISEDVDYSSFKFSFVSLKFDWLETVIAIKTQLGMDVLIGFDLFTDPRNSSVYRLVMGSPETTNPFPRVHSADHETEQLLGLPARHGLSKDHQPVPKVSHICFDLVTDPRNSSVYRLVLGSPETTNPFPSHIDCDMVTDPRNSSVYRLVVGSPETTNPFPSLREKEVAAIYKLFYAEVIKMFIEESGDDKTTSLAPADLDEHIIQTASDYYDLREEFYDLESNNDTDVDEDLYLSIPEYTVQELQTLIDTAVAAAAEAAAEDGEAATIPPPGAIWQRYLEGVFNASDVQLDFETDKILVSAPDLKYLALMTVLIAKTPPVSLQLYVWMKVVEVMSAHTTTELRLLATRTRQAARGGTGAGGGEPARSLLCADAANDMLGLAVAYAIADPHFLEVTKPKILTMVHELKRALAHLVGRARWMDDDTKLATFQKIIRMKTLVGFPDWLLEPGALEAHYAGLEVHNDTHLENMLNIIQFKVKKALNKFREGNNFTWATDPTEVNAYHTFQENTISRQFDAQGNLIPWWSNATVAGFLNITKCFVDQYSAYYLAEVGEYVDGKKTLGENIADNGGVREALVALHQHMRHSPPEPKLPGFEHFTPEQLFFLSYGNLWCGVFTREALEQDLEDEHAPQKLRAAGALANTPEFARAFHCKPGTPMNPEPKQRCVVF
ncbi:peptidase family m13 domain-containing protein [Phthorimaea operculella]|nr:peptidase family m13 domain-containing protein [Phthorimaea operculella]